MRCAAGPAPEKAVDSADAVKVIRRMTAGYTLSFWVADVATGEGKEFWHNEKDDKEFNAINPMWSWTGADHVMFEAEPQEWTRWYSVSISNPQRRPVMLTPGDGAVEQIT